MMKYLKQAWHLFRDSLLFFYKGLKENLLKDLAHQQGFLASVEKKLSNEKFVQNAKPEVLAIEQKKKADALARIQTIEESLAQL